MLTINKFYSTTSILVLAISILGACSKGNNAEGMKATDYPDYESAAAQLYIARCSECHAAPLPKIHIARHWPGVVQRMEMRMQNKAIQPPNKQETAMILEYLQKHARQ